MLEWGVDMYNSRTSKTANYSFWVSDVMHHSMPCASRLARCPHPKLVIPDGTLAQTSLVVIGDTDFASNKYAGSAMNSDLIINSINWLAKDYELITIRPKTQSFRELVLTSSERDFIRWSGWLLMPSLIGMGGVISWWRRR